MGRKSIKPPKNPNDYKARNGSGKGVFGMVGNGILPAGICEPCRAPQGGLARALRGLSRGVRGGGIGGQTRDRNRRVPFPASGSGAILAGLWQRQDVRNGGASGGSEITAPLMTPPPPELADCLTFPTLPLNARSAIIQAMNTLDRPQALTDIEQRNRLRKSAS